MLLTVSVAGLGMALRTRRDQCRHSALAGIASPPDLFWRQIGHADKWPLHRLPGGDCEPRSDRSQDRQVGALGRLRQSD
jgi:hypothetical protein